MLNRITGLCLAVMLVPALALAPQRAEVPVAKGLDAAVAWLHTQQQDDGGFSNGVSEGSDLPTTADAVVAMVSAGIAPSSWTRGGHSPMDYLAGASDQVGPSDTGKIAKLALAVQASGGKASDFAGEDWVAHLQETWNSQTGLYAADVYSGALVVLALHAAGASVEGQAVDGFLSYRLPDGSYSFNGDPTPGSGDSNTTALVVQALVAAGADADQVAPSLAYFLAAQNDDGGWTYQKPSPYGEATDANSTALVLQAVLAAGESPSAWNNPTGALLALQTDKGGLAFNADTPGDNLLATVQAIPALAGFTLVQLPVAGGAEGGGQPFPLVVVVIEILLILLVGAAIANRRSH